MDLSLKFYFDQARELSIDHQFIVRDLGYFLNALGVSSTAIVLEDDLEMSKENYLGVENFFSSYIEGTPLDYILNESSFLDFKFYVDPRVLIPRPETELIVERVLNFSLDQNAKVLEVGTGSGCISISLAILRPHFKLIASDLFVDALEVAKINLHKYKVSNLLFVRSNWLSHAKPGSLDLVISNPPYLKPEDKHLKDLTHEPKSALISPNGTKSFSIISNQAMLALKPSGRIIFEHGYSQRLEVTNILKENGFRNIVSEQDLQGLDRLIFADK